MSDKRGYSSALINEVAAADPALPTVRLAKMCFTHNISVYEVAALLGVSRMTIYKWFCGKVTPRAKHIEKICRLVSKLERA